LEKDIIKFSDAEASLGAEWAKEKTGVSLDKIALRLIADIILVEKRRCKQSFWAVRRSVLNGNNIRPGIEREAWNRALGKMNSLRRVTQLKYQPKTPRKNIVRPRIPEIVEGVRGQLAWKF
jgi:hypothetical protein